VSAEGAQPPASASVGSTGADWEALEQRPEFRQLVAERRRFVIPALCLFVVWFGTFLGLAAYARGFMRKQPIGHISWAYLLALSLILMTWGIAFAYLRWSDRRLAPLIERLQADQAGARR
jgi:uncharacterized membrane protein (DUF485 family)